jgi:hypothetical protein
VHRTVRCTTGPSLELSGARSPSFFGAYDSCSFGPVGAPDSPVPLPTVGAGYASPADCAVDRCAGDRWLTGQSGVPPDSLVNYRRTPPNFSRERPFHRRPTWRTGHCPVHHQTQSGAPPGSPVCQTELSFGCTEPSLFGFFSSSFLTVSST